MLRTLRMSVVVEAVVVKSNFNKSLECRDKKSKSPFFFFTSPHSILSSSSTTQYHHHHDNRIHPPHINHHAHTNHPPSPFFTITTPKPKLILKILGRYNNNLTTTQLQKRNNNNLGVIVRWVKQKLPTHTYNQPQHLCHGLWCPLLCAFDPPSFLNTVIHSIQSPPALFKRKVFKTGLKGGSSCVHTRPSNIPHSSAFLTNPLSSLSPSHISPFT